MKASGLSASSSRQLCMERDSSAPWQKAAHTVIGLQIMKYLPELSIPAVGRLGTEMPLLGWLPVVGTMFYGYTVVTSAGALASRAWKCCKGDKALGPEKTNLLISGLFVGSALTQLLLDSQGQSDLVEKISWGLTGASLLYCGVQKLTCGGAQASHRSTSSAFTGAGRRWNE